MEPGKWKDSGFLASVDIPWDPNYVLSMMPMTGTRIKEFQLTGENRFLVPFETVWMAGREVDYRLEVAPAGRQEVMARRQMKKGRD